MVGLCYTLYSLVGGLAYSQPENTTCIIKNTLKNTFKMVQEKRFYKEGGLWYIDLPEFLNAGLGTKANLLMVEGSDILLDILSKNKEEVTLLFSSEKFSQATHKAKRIQSGLNQELLNSIGHAPVNYGMYYQLEHPFVHKFWLCPVTEYVFNGQYPEHIHITVK
jgi:hypothetical protein